MSGSEQAQALLAPERVRELLAGATPGEWYLAAFARPCVTLTGSDEDGVTLVTGPVKTKADAEIMVAAPDLARQVIALSAENAALLAENAQLRAQAGAVAVAKAAVEEAEWDLLHCENYRSALAGVQKARAALAQASAEGEAGAEGVGQ